MVLLHPNGRWDGVITCYVCEGSIDFDVDKFCYKRLDGADSPYSYRHLWHGVPGITKTAPSAGIQGYAMTLAEAKTRALYYIESNPYAAPEVKADESLILEEVIRLEELANA